MNMNKKNTFFILMTACCLVFVQCKKNTIDPNQDFFPPVQVYTNLNLNLPTNIGLTFPQGYLYLPQGNKGIVVYNSPNNGYVAYDRTCSYNPTEACAAVTVDSNYIGLRCGTYQVGATPSFKPCCESIFDLNTSIVSKGPATRPLKQYFTSYDVSTNILYISSSPL